MSTCLNYAANAAIWALWGPPWSIGNTPKSIWSAKFYFEKIMPALGPLNDLWVVDDTTSEYSNGLFNYWAATSPLMWAISDNK